MIRYLLVLSNSLFSAPSSLPSNQQVLPFSLSFLTVNSDLHYNHFCKHGKRKGSHRWDTLGTDYWSKAKNEQWLKWTCCGREANSAPCAVAVVPHEVCSRSIVRVFCDANLRLEIVKFL